MIELNYQQHFEPSLSTRRFWLYTRKNRSIAYGFERPGLFDAPNLFWPSMGVVAILLLEGLATYVSFDHGVIITAILASIFVDFVLAVVAHLPSYRIVLEENRRIFSRNEEGEIATRRARNSRRWQRFFYLLILLSGLFKFVWFSLVHPMFDATSLLVLVCYLLGAILHIAATGYFFFTLIFWVKFKRDERQYVYSKGTKHAFDTGCPTKTRIANGSISLIEAKVGHHSIAFDAAAKSHYLFTNGVLTDTELNELVSKQNTPEQQFLVAREGVRVQVNMLG